MRFIRQNPVLRETIHVLVPLIALYALYVQFHGDFGAGGGFQAGTAFAVGLIVYGLVYGHARLARIISPRVSELLACGGLLLFAGVGCICIALGGDFLDYNALLDHSIAAQHLGIMLVELGVGVAIVGVLTAVFALFAEDFDETTE